jgi:hypothetical protein
MVALHAWQTPFPVHGLHFVLLLPILLERFAGIDLRQLVASKTLETGDCSVEHARNDLGRNAVYDGIRRTRCSQSLDPFEDRKILA